MQNRNWLTSNRQQRRIFGGSTTPLRRKVGRLLEPWVFGVIVILLVLSLTACAPLPPVPCQAPVMPAPPELSQPLPEISYSLNVQQKLQTWREKLTGTPATLKP